MNYEQGENEDKYYDSDKEALESAVAKNYIPPITMDKIMAIENVEKRHKKVEDLLIEMETERFNKGQIVIYVERGYITREQGHRIAMLNSPESRSAIVNLLGRYTYDVSMNKDKADEVKSKYIKIFQKRILKRTGIVSTEEIFEKVIDLLIDAYSTHVEDNL